MFKRREKFLTLARKPNFNYPANSVVTILTLKTANTRITFALAAAMNKNKLITPAKMKHVNEIQPTKRTVVFKVISSNLQETTSWSKAAYRGLELFLRKGVQNKIHSSAICL
jgi:hypothetical protein